MRAVSDSGENPKVPQNARKKKVSLIFVRLVNALR